MKIAPLSKAEVDPALQQLNASGQPAWSIDSDSGKLMQTFQFADFVAAFGFMSQAALVAERMNHHPEWFNVYGTVRVALITHDTSGLTSLDFALATAMNAIAARTE